MKSNEAWQLFRTGKIIKKPNKRIFPQCEICGELATIGFYQIRTRYFCEFHFISIPHSAYSMFRIDYSLHISEKIKQGMELITSSSCER